MTQLPPEHEQRMSEETEIWKLIAGVLCLLFLALMLINNLPAISPAVDSFWTWALNFRGIW